MVMGAFSLPFFVTMVMRLSEILINKTNEDVLKPKLDILNKDVKRYTDGLKNPDLQPADRSLLKQKLEQAKEEIAEITEQLKEDRIDELFDTPAVWGWQRKTNDLCTAIFNVDNHSYKFTAEEYYPGSWSIGFAKTDAGRYEYGVTNTGNAALVMSTIVDIMKDFFHQYSPRQISFTADEPSRQKLYLRMITNMLPSWIVDQKADGKTFKMSAPKLQKANEGQINESIHKIPLTMDDFKELKEKFNKHIPAEIAAIILSDVLEADDLSDEFLELAKRNPNHDCRPLIINWLKTNMPNQMHHFTKDPDAEHLVHGIFSPVHGYPVPTSPNAQ